MKTLMLVSFVVAVLIGVLAGRNLLIGFTSIVEALASVV